MAPAPDEAPAPDAGEISPDVLALVARCVRQAGGREICGYLLVDGEGRQQFRLLRNVSAEPDGFAIADEDFRRLERDCARRGLSPAALLHSHPRGTELSPGDMEGFLADALPWVIVAPADGVLRHTVHGGPIGHRRA